MSSDTLRPGVRAGRGEVIAQRMRDGRSRVGVTGALAVLLGSLAIQPLLDGDWWLPAAIVVVVVIASVGHAARSLHLPAPLQPLLQFVALLATLALLFAREEATLGVLPGPGALLHLRDLAAQGRDYAISTQPPAGSDEGLLLMIVAGIGLVALVVDTLAAGLDLPGMTLLPLAALFLVPWVVGRGSAPAWTFVTAAIGWLAVVAALQSDRIGRWSPGARASTAGTGVAIAASTTVLALLAGAIMSVRGPVSSVDLGTGVGGGGTVQVDALVSLRRSLVSNDTRPVITLATTGARPDYLRLSILELFDGEQWRPVGPNETAPQPPAGPDGTVPSITTAPTGSVVEYRLDVGPLGGSTLPSPSGAYASLNEWPVVWDQRTSLPQRADGDSVEGARVGLAAIAQQSDSDTLRAASTVPPRPEQVFGENLADPTPLTGEELPQLARDITAGSATPFDAAVALQRWFTIEGDFTYSTQIEGGSDEDALATFLEERIGYCEQFAATMALMARAVGIPARVVVGFTQGRLEGDQWVVRGTDAHAWPELWMGSAGWVRFEPTPGAATTNTPRYSTAAPDVAAPTVAPTQGSAAPSQESSAGPTRGAVDELAADGGQASADRGLPLGWVALAVVLALSLVPAVVRMVRRRRRLSAGDGDAAYREIVDTLIDLRLGTESSTPRTTLFPVTSLIGSGDGTGGDGGPQEGTDAVARILRAVEWQRYGSAGSTLDAAAPGAAGSPPRADSQGGIALLEQRPTTGSAPRPGALNADVRIVRQALARRAGSGRRVVAAVAPRSVLAPATTRISGRGGE